MKKLSRAFWFRAATILFLLLLAGLMLIIGRGHTLYFDNKTLDAEGKSYNAFYKTVVKVKNNEDQKLYARERGMASIMGQSVKVVLEITDKKNGSSKTETYTVKVPYNMDEVVINMPALVAGADQSVWMTKFVSLATATETVAEETVVTDEFGLSDI